VREEKNPTLTHCSSSADLHHLDPGDHRPHQPLSAPHAPTDNDMPLPALRSSIEAPLMPSWHLGADGRKGR